MKIAIDYSIRAVKNRGISRFVDDLIESSPYEIIALAPEGSSVKHIPNIIEGFSFFPWWEQYELPRLCKKYKVDILICPYNTAPIRKLNKTILITACHDLIFFEKLTLDLCHMRYFYIMCPLLKLYFVEHTQFFFSNLLSCYLY